MLTMPWVRGGLHYWQRALRACLVNRAPDKPTRGAHGFPSGVLGVPTVSVSDVKRLLRLGGCAPEDGFACLTSSCPACKATKRKEIGSVFINKTTGFFCCSGCRRQGQWAALQKYLPAAAGGPARPTSTGDEPEGSKEPYLPWSQAERDSQSLTETHTEEVLQRFNLPMVPEAGKVLRDVRVSGDTLLLPLRDLSGHVSGLRSLLRSHPDEPCQEHTEGSGLLQLGGGGRSAIIVPSAGDAIALLAAKVSGVAVCLPHGFSRLPQEELPALERFSRLTLWGAADTLEQACALARKLGDKRCLLVRSEEGPLAALRGGEDLRALSAAARPVWHKAITSFSALREDVLADLRNIEKVQGVKWKRFPALTRLLRGHRRGELTVLTGPTGCGKTTFCSEYSLDLALQGVTTLWGSFEIRNSRLARTMLQQLAGIPLDENIHLFDEYADEFEKLPIHFLTFHGQQSIKDVMEVVEHAFYVHDVAHVIVDNVQFMLGMGDEPSRSMDRYWRQDAVIAAFRGFATRNNCHVTLVMHPRKERDAEDLSTSSIFGSAKASQEADCVLIIQDKRLTSVRGKKYLQVAKNRYSGDLGIVPLEFDKGALSYAQKKKDKDSKPQKEGDGDRESHNNAVDDKDTVITL